MDVRTGSFPGAPCGLPRRLRRGLLAGLLAGLCLSGWTAFQPLPAQAEESLDPGRALLEAGRRDLPLERRLAAAARVLRSDQPVEAESALRASLTLFEEAPDTAAWLILRALDADRLTEAARKRAFEALSGPDRSATAESRARWAAVQTLLGRRPADAPAALTAVWPASDFVRAVLQREIGFLGAGLPETGSGKRILDGDAATVRDALARTRAAAAALDAAVSDDPETMRKGLDGLLAKEVSSVPLLLHEARHGAAGTPAGRMPRAARAILALGMLGDRRATPVLADCLRSTAGWVRVAAATALGDLGDPAGAVPLAVHLATLGDLHRPRDSWDYPGTSGTTVPEADWRRVDYFVIDIAAADSLLRLGVPRAAGYVIQNKLDPSKGNYRIRVLQDAVDALRRALPDAAPLVLGYNVDAGLASRDAAFMNLADWWHGHRDDPNLLAVTLDETDAGFRKAARALVDRLTGKDVRQFMITKPACALLGHAVTPTLIETLAGATRGAARAELAKTLGLVRDPRAIDPLLGLLADERPFVRAAAAEALGTYADRPRVREALIARLEDRKEGPRVSAVAGLLGAPPTQAVLDAVRSATPKQTGAGPAPALTILLLVQEGDAHWRAVEMGLNAEHRYERENWWGLLQRALDLPAYLHDAGAAPDAKQVRRLTVERMREARTARRSP